MIKKKTKIEEIRNINNKLKINVKYQIIKAKLKYY